MLGHKGLDDLLLGFSLSQMFLNLGAQGGGRAAIEHSAGRELVVAATLAHKGFRGFPDFRREDLTELSGWNQKHKNDQHKL